MTKIIKCPACNKNKPVRDDAKVCSSNCRVKQWRKTRILNVDMTNLKRPLKNRGLDYMKNENGTVTINGKAFDRARDVEDYLITIDRLDLVFNKQ